VVYKGWCALVVCARVNVDVLIAILPATLRIWTITLPEVTTDSSIQTLLHPNTNSGKLNRGISVVDTAELLLGRNLEGEEYKRVALLGWCVELVSRYPFSSYTRSNPTMIATSVFPRLR